MPNGIRDKRPKGDVAYDGAFSAYATIVFRPVCVAVDANASWSFFDCGVGAGRAVVAASENDLL